MIKTITIALVAILIILALIPGVAYLLTLAGAKANNVPVTFHDFTTYCGAVEVFYCLMIGVILLVHRIIKAFE